MPLVPAELYARMRQLDWRTATFGSDEVLKIDELVIDIAGLRGARRGRRIELTHQEFELLRFLGAAPRTGVHARGAARARVGLPLCGRDAHGRHPRPSRALEAGCSAGSLIETVRNVGYKMRG